MDRNTQMDRLIAESRRTPQHMEGMEERVKSRLRARRCRRRAVALSSVAALIAAFVLSVSMFPRVALAVSSVPGLRGFAGLLTSDPSTKAAIDNDFVQYLGETKRAESGAQVTLNMLIPDALQTVIYYDLTIPEGMALFSVHAFKPDDVSAREYGYSGTNTEYIFVDGQNDFTRIDGSVGVRVMSWESLSMQTKWPEQYAMPGEFILRFMFVTEESLVRFWSGGEDEITYDEMQREYVEFTIKPDERRMVHEIVEIGEIVELMGETVLIKSAMISPVTTAIHAEYTGSKLKDLIYLGAHVEAGDGQVLTPITEYEYPSEAFLESSTSMMFAGAWFDTSESLTLVIGSAKISGEKVYLPISYESGGSELRDLEGIRIGDMVLEDGTLTVYYESDPGYYFDIYYNAFAKSENSTFYTDVDYDFDSDALRAISFTINGYKEGRFFLEIGYGLPAPIDPPIRVKIK